MTPASDSGVALSTLTTGETDSPVAFDAGTEKPKPLTAGPWWDNAWLHAPAFRFTPLYWFGHHGAENVHLYLWIAKDACWAQGPTPLRWPDLRVTDSVPPSRRVLAGPDSRLRRCGVDALPDELCHPRPQRGRGVHLNRPGAAAARAVFSTRALTSSSSKAGMVIG